MKQNKTVIVNVTYNQLPNFTTLDPNTYWSCMVWLPTFK